MMKHRDAVVAAAVFAGLGGWIADPLWAAVICGVGAGAFMVLGDIAGAYIDAHKKDAG